jgi:hypothetical protein
MVEHTKKVMVIEDNEVVHVRVRISCHARILLKLMTSLLLKKDHTLMICQITVCSSKTNPAGSKSDPI